MKHNHKLYVPSVYLIMHAFTVYHAYICHMSPPPGAASSGPGRALAPWPGPGGPLPPSASSAEEPLRSKAEAHEVLVPPCQLHVQQRILHHLHTGRHPLTPAFSKVWGCSESSGPHRLLES